MEEQLINFGTAKLAKEKGFNILTDMFFTIKGDKYLIRYLDKVASPTGIACPSQSLLQKWLREVHKIHMYIELTIKGFGIDMFSEPKGRCNIRKYYKTYEEALEESLQEALKLI